MPGNITKWTALMQFSIWKHSRISTQIHSTLDDRKALSFVSDKRKALILVKSFSFHCFLSYTFHHIFLSLFQSLSSVFSLAPDLLLNSWLWGHLLTLLHTPLLQLTTWPASAPAALDSYPLPPPPTLTVKRSSKCEYYHKILPSINT